MKTIYFIRHFKTKGNIEKRYVGKTDESIIESASYVSQKGKFDFVEHVFSSPMKRCIETASIFCPEKEITIIDELRETDFGDFEYKNYEELKENKNYKKWLESGGNSSFPNGENIEDMKKRCILAYNKILNIIDEKGINTCAVICHGGTIMAIMEYLKGGFYNWQCENGKGIYIVINDNQLEAEKIQGFL